MSISISLTQLCSVVGGRQLESTARTISFQGVEYDSREVRGGELFVALKGEKTHGHQFVPLAFQRGAAAVLVEDEAVARALPEPCRAVIVSDTLAALWSLARWWRSELAVPVLAITGSVGKTTVKEIAASVLLRHSVGNFSVKSFNNHVGVPYTILKTSREHRWLILEMGMNHAGEIRALTRIGSPNVAVISKIAPAHIENLGSLAAIADAKCEIVEGLRPGGQLVVNGDDPELLAAIARLQASPPLVRVGASAESGLDAMVSDVRAQGLEGIAFSLVLGGQRLEVSMNIVGTHNALNAAIAAAAARALLPDLSVEKITEGLSSFKAPLMRLNLKALSRGRTVVDDSYNANPASMRSLLEIARDLAQSGKKVGLVLADMLELGGFSEQFHREIGEVVAQCGAQFLITVGRYAVLYADAPGKAGVRTFEAATPELAAHIATTLDFDILLVKGSRGMKLDRAVATLLEREGGEQPATPFRSTTTPRA